MYFTSFAFAESFFMWEVIIVLLQGSWLRKWPMKHDFKDNDEKSENI